MRLNVATCHVYNYVCADHPKIRRSVVKSSLRSFHRHEYLAKFRLDASNVSWFQAKRQGAIMLHFLLSQPPPIPGL